jgi:hypothetical protein
MKGDLDLLDDPPGWKVEPRTRFAEPLINYQLFAFAPDHRVVSELGV